MQRTLTSLIKTVTCATLALGVVAQVKAADAPKADPTGTWTWSTPGRGGGDPTVSTLKLKLEGDKVTGTLSAPGRGGGAATESAIANGKLAGDQVTFLLIRDRNGTMTTNKYEGKLTGDTIKGTSERPARAGGDPTKTDWEAKREAAKK
jgi:hypothetical protein